LLMADFFVTRGHPFNGGHDAQIKQSGSLGVLMTLAPSELMARDDGRFAGSPLKEWFDHLSSKNGLCCAFADGVSMQDVDWDTQEGHYRVRIRGEWFVVPDDAVVAEPNRLGSATEGLLLHCAPSSNGW